MGRHSVGVPLKAFPVHGESVTWQAIAIGCKAANMKLENGRVCIPLDLVL